MAKQPARLLIVDHNKLNRENLANRLKKQSYQVITANDGYIALGMLDVHKFDLVILERNLPKIDGEKLLTEMRSKEEWRHIPVIMTISSDDTDCRTRCIELGADDCLPQPINTQFLSARIKTCLARKAIFDQQNELQTQLTSRVSELVSNSTVDQNQQADILNVLAQLLESRRDDGIAHLERTRDYCTILCRKLASKPNLRSYITEQYITNFRYAAPLHDIGEVLLPDSTRLNETKLSNIEWEAIKMHPVIGAGTLRSIQKSSDSEFLRMAICLVESHHEKWDGSGYPAGKEKEEIPMTARIFAVADAYDSLTSRRRYRDSATHEQAVKLITKDRGKQFDPDVVDAFVAAQQAFSTIQSRHEATNTYTRRVG